MHIKEILAEASYGSLVNQDKYDALDSDDQQLYKYTADGFTYIGHHYDSLAEKYPYAGGTLYRGLHFDDQEQFDKFMDAIHDGSITTTSTSSWTPDKGTAHAFSTTKKSYFPTLELMRAERDKNDAGDHMTGYGGVVIKTTVDKGVGIDVNKSDFAKEPEVILPSGTYPIEIVERNHPFKISHNTPDKVAEMLAAIKKGSGTVLEKDQKSLLNKYATYLLQSWIDKLEPEQVDILAKYWIPRDIALGHATPEEVAEKSITFEFNEDIFKKKRGTEAWRLDLRVWVPLDYSLYEKCTPALQKRMDRYTKAIAARMAKAMSDVAADPRLDHLTDAYIEGIQWLTQFPGTEATLNKGRAALRAALGKRYHQLNSREHNKTLKSMDDIRAHGEKVAKLVSVMSNI